MADRDRQDEAEGRMLPKWYMQLAGVITGVAFTLALLAAGYLAFRVWVMGLAPFSLEALTVASMVLATALTGGMSFGVMRSGEAPRTPVMLLICVLILVSMYLATRGHPTAAAP